MHKDGKALWSLDENKIKQSERFRKTIRTHPAPARSPCRHIDYFDLILAMDKSNLDNLRRFAPPSAHDRIKLFMDFSRNFDDDEVPDPYYGLGHGFDLVLDMIEDAAQGLIDELKPKLNRT